MTMPNFLVLGAAKAGTTALYAYFKQHPQVYLTPFKETKFFCHEGEQLSYQGPGDQENNSRLVNNLTAYQELYERVTTEKAIGEICPPYLYFPKACERIKHHVPHVQLFAILRNPVDRAYSSFLHLIRDGREPIKEFRLALLEEENRIRENYAPLWFYKDLGRYYHQVKRYFDAFGRDRVHISLYEDFDADPIQFMQQMCRVLEIDDRFVPDVSRKWNVSGVPKSQAIHSLLSGQNAVTAILERVPGGAWLRTKLRYGNLAKPPFPPQVRAELIAEFREDVLNLQDLLERDLSGWLK